MPKHERPGSPHHERHREGRSSKANEKRGQDEGDRKRRKDGPQTQGILPYEARPLHKRDLMDYAPMLALYLDIQKQISIDDLSQEEVRGRWKSFVGKW